MKKQKEKSPLFFLHFILSCRFLYNIVQLHP
jgi:hypothetical protein